MHRRAALLFDLDGTLIDSSRAICDAAAESFAALDVTVAPRDIEPHLGAPLEELYALFVGDSDDGRRSRFVDGYIVAHDAHPERHPAPLPGVLAGLDALLGRYGVPLAVATTKPSHRARAQLEACGLLARFAHVQGTDRGMDPKPRPDVIEHACRMLAVSACDVVMVGDTRRDVDAARGAGARAVVVAYSDEGEERASAFGADLVVRSLEQLVDVDFDSLGD